MSKTTDGGAAPPTFNKSKLFWLSAWSMITEGVIFNVRAGVLADMQRTYFDPLNSATAAGGATAMVGEAFLGFAIVGLIASPLCDLVGMGPLMIIAGIVNIGGILGTILTPVGPNAPLYLGLSMVAVGSALGIVEAVGNPLIATIFPDDKTNKLNILHAYYPGGLIIGGLLAALLPFSWQIKMASAIIPAAIYLLMSIGTKFPRTERVQAGVSNHDMVSAVFSPGFIFLCLAMMMTASMELAPGQWVPAALTRTVHLSGIWLLVYVAGLQFVMRFFAGGIVKYISPVGLLWVSCVLALVGLVALGYANSPLSGFLGATLWGVGVCYLWPTMLGVVSERMPRTGALGLGIIGALGNGANFITMPIIGRVFDAAKVQAVGGADAFRALEAAAKAGNAAAQAQLDPVLAQAASHSFLVVAILPIVLIVAFGVWWAVDRKHGGYHAENLLAEESTSD